MVRRQPSLEDRRQPSGTNAILGRVERRPGIGERGGRGLHSGGHGAHGMRWQLPAASATAEKIPGRGWPRVRLGRCDAGRQCCAAAGCAGINKGADMTRLNRNDVI